MCVYSGLCIYVGRQIPRYSCTCMCISDSACVYGNMYICVGMCLYTQREGGR